MDGYTELQMWSCTPLGGAFLATEKQLLREVVAHQFGFHLVFSGEISCFTLLQQESPILHRIMVAPTPVQNLNSVCARLDQLPFLTESLDLLILQHSLEFLGDPYALLQEAARVLLPEGRLVVFLFNPISPWGLLKILKSKVLFPWCLHFYSRRRVVNWLKVLGFAEIDVEYYFNRPPVDQAYFLSKLKGLEKWECLRWLGLGGGYRIVAKKRKVCVTPTQIFAPAKRRLVITGLAPSG